MCVVRCALCVVRCALCVVRCALCVVLWGTAFFLVGDGARFQKHVDNTAGDGETPYGFLAAFVLLLFFIIYLLLFAFAIADGYVSRENDLI